ncbi:hypothetical protein FOZ61_006241 [Perkinsus olseni]|uniref:Uncharacterized protein n=1 Tax=Perkinsus olseni TaxID=32597 RepID=A0A7J6LRI1_PEROL|nr:hypothetical protein FOZ61_006241 [Perkinsus olseni]KAF4661905.1 hypothetical protein FOL46_005530 [Perkinsus olseni]
MSASSIAARFGLKISEAGRGRVEFDALPAFCSGQYLVDVINEALRLRVQDPMMWSKIESRGIELGSSPRCKFSPSTICIAWMGVHDASFLDRYDGLRKWLDKELSRDDNLHGLSSSTLHHVTTRATADQKWALAEAAITRLVGKSETLTDVEVLMFAECVEKLQESKMCLSDGILGNVVVLVEQRKERLDGDDDDHCIRVSRLLNSPVFGSTTKLTVNEHEVSDDYSALVLCK